MSIVERSRRHYGVVKKLRPGEAGKCWFHGQHPHCQDRAIFRRNGGTVGACQSAPVLNASYASEAELCDCVAPPNYDGAFNKNFLEIGAADGQYLSNLLFFEMQMEWSGICVEGSPTSFPILQSNRPSCRTVNAVIAKGAPGDSKVFYTFDSPGSWEIGMSCMQGG